MTAAQMAIVWWFGAAMAFAVGTYLGVAYDAGSLDDKWGWIAGTLWLATFPCALVGFYWLIRAAVHPGGRDEP